MIFFFLYICTKNKPFIGVNMRLIKLRFDTLILVIFIILLIIKKFQKNRYNNYCTYIRISTHFRFEKIYLIK